MRHSGMAQVNEGSHCFTCHPHVYPQVEWTIPGFTPQPQSVTAFWLVLISCPTEGRRLSWSWWLVTNWSGSPAWRRSPVLVRTVTSMNRTLDDQSRSTATVPWRYHFFVPLGVGGWVVLSGWLCTKTAYLYVKMVTHLHTNRALCCIASLMWLSTLPLAKPQLKTCWLTRLCLCFECFPWLVTAATICTMKIAPIVCSRKMLQMWVEPDYYQPDPNDEKQILNCKPIKICISIQRLSWHCYLCHGGYVFVIVCLSVCLLATLHKNFQTDLRELFREGWQWANEQMIKFWCSSG